MHDRITCARNSVQCDGFGELARGATPTFESNTCGQAASVRWCSEIAINNVSSNVDDNSCRVTALRFDRGRYRIAEKLQFL